MDQDLQSVADDESTKTGEPARQSGGGRRRSWKSRVPFGKRLRQVRAERDRALSELSAARRGLRAAREERNAARSALKVALAERDGARATLDAVSNGQAESQRFRQEVVAELERESKRIVHEVHESRALQTRTDRRVRLLHRELMTDIQALHQLLGRYAPEARLPPVAGWALSPAGLLALVDLIETRDASNVVECGSGTSTLWIGYALKRLGRGRVIALDHLPEYADKTRAIVAAHGLQDFVEVRLAPLVPRQTPRGEYSWYDFDTAELTGHIDVLLVDGPPQSTGPLARYPALSVFLDHLAPDAIVVADDMDRSDERKMLELWLEDVRHLRRVESPGPGIEVLELADT